MYYVILHYANLAVDNYTGFYTGQYDIIYVMIRSTILRGGDDTSVLFVYKYTREKEECLENLSG